MMFAGRLALAALSAAIFAWVLTAVVLYAKFVAGGYTVDAYVELPPWAFGAIGGGGAGAGLAMALFASCCTLPMWVRPVLLGSMGGVASVVVGTLVIAWTLAGPKMYASYQHAGLVYGVPLGFVVGAIGGLLSSRLRLLLETRRKRSAG